MYEEETEVVETSEEARDCCILVTELLGLRSRLQRLVPVRYRDEWGISNLERDIWRLENMLLDSRFMPLIAVETINDGAEVVCYAFCGLPSGRFA